MRAVITPFLVLFIASAAFAQQGPPPPQPGGQNQHDHGTPPPPPHEGHGGGMMCDMCCMGGEMGNRPGPEHMGGRMPHVQMMRGYLDLVERFTRLSENPSSAGVAAVVTAGEILKAKGNDAAIDYFNRVLPDAKDPTVRRAIHLQLAHTYKAAGNADKALDQLQMLMTDTGSSPPAKSE